jgi:shikimate dehydrogenase
VRLVLLGDPVAHSRSPAIHNAALAALGIEGRYWTRRVNPAGVYAACAEIRAGTLDGANVTMPHKAVAAAAADRVAAVAARCRAVNTLFAEGGEVVGDNTDVPGIRLALDRAGLPSAGPVLVLGAGGTAAAVMVALEGRELVVSARRAGEAEATAALVGVRARPVPWGEAVSGAVVANATPLGREGDRLPDGVVEEAVALIDFAYGSEPTPAVVAAMSAGIGVIDGIDLLVAQAALSFELWTGLAAPYEVMAAAARA